LLPGLMVIATVEATAMEHRATAGDLLRLVVFTPTASVLDQSVSRMMAQGHDGAFGLLPRHNDFVAPLVPGVMSFVDVDGAERFIAVDGGVLLKTEGTVRVATRHAVLGEDLLSLRQTVEQEFLALTEHEREARNAVARLEAGVIRRFLEIESLR
jgi:F-type H+-transporting ATPase subunit epsilon